MSRPRFSSAHLIALISLFVALGGVGYAATVLPANSVGTKQLRNAAVTSGKLARNAVTSAKVKDGSLLAADFAAGQLVAGPAGPQGAQGVQGPKGDTGSPGATSLVYDASGSASRTRRTIGTLGPWTATGLCTQSGGSTGIEIDVSGPGYHADVLDVGGSTATAATGTVPGPVTNFAFGSIDPVSNQSVESANALLVPTSGQPVQLLFTIAATGGTPPPGTAANTCHASAAITPVAAPASSSAPAVAQVPVGKSSAAPHGKTMLGLPLASRG